MFPAPPGSGSAPVAAEHPPGAGPGVISSPPSAPVGHGGVRPPNPGVRLGGMTPNCPFEGHNERNTPKSCTQIWQGYHKIPRGNPRVPPGISPGGHPKIPSPRGDPQNAPAGSLPVSAGSCSVVAARRRRSDRAAAPPGPSSSRRVRAGPGDMAGGHTRGEHTGWSRQQRAAALNPPGPAWGSPGRASSGTPPPVVLQGGAG